MVTMVVGADGSTHSTRALEWCAAHARGDDEVLVVHAVELPLHAVAAPHGPPSLMTDEEREQLRELIARDWCKPLADAGVPFCVVLADDGAARALLDVARAHDAELIVVGRRGRGGFAGLVLGSTSHHVLSALDRPLVVVP